MLVSKDLAGACHIDTGTGGHRGTQGDTGGHRGTQGDTGRHSLCLERNLD